MLRRESLYIVQYLIQQMEQLIMELREDDEQQWVAVLSCGHTRHFRHNPPWEDRPWVVSAEGRARFVGNKVECVQCDGAAAGQIEARSEGTNQ